MSAESRPLIPSFEAVNRLAVRVGGRDHGSRMAVRDKLPGCQLSTVNGGGYGNQGKKLKGRVALGFGWRRTCRG